MRTKLLCTFVFAWMLTGTGIFAQRNSDLSVLYRYSTRYIDGSKQHYPFGLESFYTLKFPGKLIISAGIGYSHLADIRDNQITPAVYRTHEIYTGSICSVTAGLGYALIDRKFKIRPGAGLVCSYFHSSMEMSRYLVSNDQMDLHFKIYDDSFSPGVKVSLDVLYSPGNRISILIQPGYSWYFLGEEKEEKILNASGGLAFSF